MTALGSGEARWTGPWAPLQTPHKPRLSPVGKGRARVWASQACPQVQRHDCRPCYPSQSQQPLSRGPSQTRLHPTAPHRVALTHPVSSLICPPPPRPRPAPWWRCSVRGPNAMPEHGRVRTPNASAGSRRPVPGHAGKARGRGACRGRGGGAVRWPSSSMLKSRLCGPQGELNPERT